jgi:hypothetical protein
VVPRCKPPAHEMGRLCRVLSCTRLAVAQAVYDTPGDIHCPNPAEYPSLDRLCWSLAPVAAPYCLAERYLAPGHVRLRVGPLAHDWDLS